MGLVTRLSAAVRAFSASASTVKGSGATTPLGSPAERYYPLFVNPSWAVTTADDLVQRKGLAVYREMLERDDQVASCIGLLTFARLASGWTIAPASEDETDKKAAAFVERVFADLTESSVGRLLQDALEALPMGFACVEKVWGEPYATGDFRGLRPYRTFRALPQETITVKRNDVGDIEPDGIWQSKPMQMVAPGLSPDLFEHYERDRFILWSWRRKWGNPLGMSILRPAYRWYFLKTKTIEWWARYMEYFGQPWVWGEVPTGTGDTEKDKILDTLRRFQTQQRIVLESGTKLNIVEPQATAVLNYDQLLQRCDRGIARTIFTPATLVDTTEIGSYALGKAQKGTYEWVLDNLGQCLQDEVMHEGAIAPLIDHNFGPDVQCPTFRFKDFSEPDRLAIANLYKVLVEIGMPIGISTIRKSLNIEAPTDDDEVLGGATPSPTQGIPRDAIDEAAQIDALLGDLLEASTSSNPSDEMAGAIRGNGKRVKSERPGGRR